MKVSDFIAGFLAEKGITDAFGIPGGVILELIYAFERTKKIIPHLSYHEQCSAFEASGYAQAGAPAGVAFATRGPGIMNTLTSVADAYCDSSAVIVFTAHATGKTQGRIRMMENQEFDLEPIFKPVCKAYIRMDAVQDVKKGIWTAYKTATSGRKGPVVVDVLSSLLNMEMEADKTVWETSDFDGTADEGRMQEIAQTIAQAVSKSSRPVLLIGDGVKQAGVIQETVRFAEQNNLPVLSSRYAEDTMPLSKMYFGYIGTHAVRAANYILSKADLIVGLGNRMAFPVNSASYRPLAEATPIIRIDVDAAEFEREIPGTVNYEADLSLLMPVLAEKICKYENGRQWLEVCGILKEALKNQDINEPIRQMSELLENTENAFTVTSDVGNNEMWLSRAYINAGAGNQILYSKAFGALGCSVAKAIGAYYATKKPVVCFVGDQGLQLNIQELQVISYNRLPICVILMNNDSSGMIREHEEAKYAGHPLLVTRDSGYAPADAEKICAAYNIPYYCYNKLSNQEIKGILKQISSPVLLEVKFGAANNVMPILKKGDPCQKLFPYLKEETYNYLNAL